LLGATRQSAILKAVTARGSCTVTELARELDVSGETIRRDIRVMARQGLVRKVHGGVSVPDQLRESSFRQRLMENAEAKQAIARLAAAQVQSGDSLMMDTGSTTAYIARELADQRGDDGALFGGEAVRFVERFRSRVALLSIGAIDLDSGFMDFHPEEAEFSQAVIAQASRVVVAADREGLRSFGRRCADHRPAAAAALRPAPGRGPSRDRQSCGLASPEY
jgi:DeoR family glycerol-3-phosphate regulon repressor